MSTLQIHDNIIQAFETYWGNKTEVAWPNLSLDSTQLSEWIRISVIFGDSDQKEMGGVTNKHRQFGTVIVEIYVDQDSGARRSLELADFASNFFHTVKVTDVTFRSPDIDHIGIESSWYKKNVACDFYSDNDF